MNIHVLCCNDYPEAVYWDLTVAEKACREKNAHEDREFQKSSEHRVRRYYHVHSVPLVMNPGWRLAGAYKPNEA